MAANHVGRFDSDAPLQTEHFMSTKNIAKTAIEGGRTGHYKRAVARDREERRAEERHFLRAVKLDPEAADGLVVRDEGPLSEVWGDEKFHDKLRPIYRFLSSNVGRPWSKVRSEVFEKFDSRTTAGRHILFDHLLKSVNESGTDAGYERHRNFIVDAYGILREGKTSKFHRYNAPPPFPDDKRRAVAKWLGARKIGLCGDKLVWFEPSWGADSIRAIWGTRDYGGPGFNRETELRWVWVDAQGKPQLVSLLWPETKVRLSFVRAKAERVASDIRYRQGRLLDKKDAAFFYSLPKMVQERVLDFAPNAPRRATRT